MPCIHLGKGGALDDSRVTVWATGMGYGCRKNRLRKWEMMNSVLDALHFRYSWDIQVENLRRQMYVTRNKDLSQTLDISQY